MSNPTLLVTGASGHLGRRAVELLLEANAGTIVAATRTPEKLADFSQRGVIVRPADFDDSASLAKAFAGVDRLLLISTDKVDVPGHRIKQQQNAVKAAEAAGVSHVVYTSIIQSIPNPTAFVSADHRATEEALAASKMGWTSLRENIYTDILLFSIIRAVQSGTLANAIGDGKAAYITREDCARAAVAALTSSFDEKRTLDITGPSALSQVDVAAIASEVSGREVTYTPLDVETVIQGMVAAGLPRPAAEAFSTFDLGIARGEFSAVSNGVEELTGRKPISVKEFVNANRAALQAVPQ